MPHQASADPPASAADFAGLLASLAALKEPPLPDEDLPLADDVATLTYEGALRSHRRTQSQGSPPLGTKADTLRAADTQIPDSPARKKATRGQLGTPAVTAPAERKCASITVRMSPEECAQLRDRASEAGMTVSAYLRSCAFEIESLRAQVKQAVAELRESRAGGEGQAPPLPAPVKRSSHERVRCGWLRKLLPKRHVLREDYGL